MKKIFWILMVLVLAEAAFAQAPASVQYTCSMHPQVVQSEPGNCPICGMKLVPMESHSEHRHPEGQVEGAYLVSPERRQLIGVRTEVVEERALKREIRLPGRVAYDQELYTTEQEYVSGLDLGAESEVLKAIETKLRRLGISEEELATLKKTRKADLSLFLPKEGGIFWVYANIYEADLSWVSKGMKALISLPKEPSVILEGEVRQVAPVVDPMTRTALARVLVAAPKISLRPETYVNVALQKEFGKLLAIPSDAAIETGTKQIVLVDLGEGYIEPREVQLGIRAGNFFPVLGGLKKGEKVITSAHFLLDSEAQLQSAMKRFGKMPAGHQH